MRFWIQKLVYGSSEAVIALGRGERLEFLACGRCRVDVLPLDGRLFARLGACETPRGDLLLR